MFVTMTTPEQRPEQVFAAIPLKWENVSNLPMLFTTNIFVRRQDDQVIITFGQTELPYDVQLSPERIKELEENGMQVQVVARLTTNRQSLSNFIDHLSTVRDNWPETLDQPEAS